MGDGLQVNYVASLYDPAKIRTDDMPVLTDQFAPTETLVSPLDNQPYSIGEEWDAQAPDSTAGSLPGGVSLAMVAVAGVWAIHFRRVWQARPA